MILDNVSVFCLFPVDFRGRLHVGKAVNFDEVGFVAIRECYSTDDKDLVLGRKYSNRPYVVRLWPRVSKTSVLKSERAHQIRVILMIMTC